ncbi:CPBP family intramembrane glutamic endopeptidase [Deinococcus gobiensis]|uniref:CPBP family intramembrane glutamic endopeptidase n=1 Tax=Deinococcus gobiensis TaxID=502394 RepID=UPI00030AE81C|nr:type II CAAX endopeptidase family protein [Deinococcus gobiensis]
MTLPDAPRPPEPPAWPGESTPAPVPPGPQIRAVDGNRAALALLIVQNVVSALLIARGAPLGTALLGAFAVTVLVAFTLFRPAMTALLRDTRWRTPPSWGTALAAFALAFIASRALALAYVLLVPSGADAVPQFLSRGADQWALFLAAGLLIPLAEEVAFRGLLMRGHERAAGFMVAALTSTFAFSLAHGVPASIAGILPLAYVLARVVQHSGSLWNSVIIHAANNTLAVALGALLAGRDLGGQGDAASLLKDEALRLPLAGGALLFGLAVLAVCHIWLTPRADPQERRVPGPWLSGAYVAVVVFGVVSLLLTLPFAQGWLGRISALLN